MSFDVQEPNARIGLVSPADSSVSAITVQTNVEILITREVVFYPSDANAGHSETSAVF